MLQRLSIKLLQVKSGNLSGDLLMLDKHDPHRLLLNLSDKINLKRSDKYVALAFT